MKLVLFLLIALGLTACGHIHIKRGASVDHVEVINPA